MSESGAPSALSGNTIPVTLPPDGANGNGTSVVPPGELQNASTRVHPGCGTSAIE